MFSVLHGDQQFLPSIFSNSIYDLDKENEFLLNDFRLFQFGDFVDSLSNITDRYAFVSMDLHYDAKRNWILWHIRLEGKGNVCAMIDANTMTVFKTVEFTSSRFKHGKSI